MTKQKFLDIIKSAVLDIDSKADIILFGSRARGDNKENSDWDILILTSKVANAALETQIRDRIYEVELEHLQPISKIILGKHEWHKLEITPFYKNVTEEGLLL